MGNDGVSAVFGRRVREERTRRGWRLEDLADAVAAQGVTKVLTAYHKIEAGTQEPRLSDAIAIAAAFGLPLGALLVETGALDARIADLRTEAARLGEESDDALRRAVQFRNEAARLAGEAQ